MKSHFEYLKLSPHKAIPAFPITLIAKSECEVDGLLDSGADMSVIPRSLAQRLGVIETGIHVQVQGEGGMVETSESELILSIDQKGCKKTFTVPIRIIDDSCDIPILLGRKGFFENFEITFFESEKRIELQPI